MDKAAVFLDRDGVLVEEAGLITSAEQLRLLPGVPQALSRLRAAGFRLVVVSNQAIVARGMINEEQLDAIHAELCRMLESRGGPRLDAIYACPHHPQADLPAYRVECDCRKPRSGLLLRAAREQGLDLAASYMIGDRITDIAAGAGAGCRTVLVRSPASDAAPIVTSEPIEDSLCPDYICDSLEAAADWILWTP
jgi:D-glycero-D-manno-heptose 1,7-bisphosphate phosphatase